MKKIIFLLFATIALKSAFAQLKNTRWEGAIKGDNPRNAIPDFKSGTVILYAASNNEIVETMTYSISGNTFTLKKLRGRVTAIIQLRENMDLKSKEINF